MKKLGLILYCIVLHATNGISLSGGEVPGTGDSADVNGKIIDNGGLVPIEKLQPTESEVQPKPVDPLGNLYGSVLEPGPVILPQTETNPNPVGNLGNDESPTDNTQGVGGNIPDPRVAAPSDNVGAQEGSLNAPGAEVNVPSGIIAVPETGENEGAIPKLDNVVERPSVSGESTNLTVVAPNENPAPSNILSAPSNIGAVSEDVAPVAASPMAFNTSMPIATNSSNSSVPGTNQTNVGNTSMPIATTPSNSSVPGTNQTNVGNISMPIATTPSNSSVPGTNTTNVGNISMPIATTPSNLSVPGTNQTNVGNTSMPNASYMSNSSVPRTNTTNIGNTSMPNATYPRVPTETVPIANGAETSINNDIPDEKVDTAVNVPQMPIEPATDDGHINFGNPETWKETGDEEWVYDETGTTKTTESRLGQGDSSSISSMTDDQPQSGDAEYDKNEGDDYWWNEEDDDDDDKDDGDDWWKDEFDDWDNEGDDEKWLDEDGNWADIDGIDEDEDDEMYGWTTLPSTVEVEWLETTASGRKCSYNDGADNENEIQAGKDLMESAHSFDNSVGAFGGAKVSSKAHLNSTSFYSYTLLLSICVVLIALFIFWNRHKVEKYIVSLRSPPPKGNGQSRMGDEEKNLLDNEYA